MKHCHSCSLPRLRSLLTRSLLLTGSMLLSFAAHGAPAPSPATAYWTGDQDANWSTRNSSNTNWATSLDGATDTQVKPGATTDVIFSATGAINKATTLDATFTVKSLTVNDTISISGSNTLNVTGDTRVDNGTLTLNAGTTLAGVNNFIGTTVGSTGSVIVTGADARWTGTADLNVGFEGGSTSLSVENGGVVSANYTKIGGYVSSTSNTVTVTGAGSQLNNTTDLLVGYGGNGNSLTLSNGGTATNANGFIGFRFDENSSSNNNTVTVTGAGSLWTNTGVLYVGEYGTGNSLALADGGQVNVTTSGKDVVVGDKVGSTGNSVTITGAHSTLSNSGTFYLGKSGGSNNLSVLASGTMLTANVRIGGDATSNNNTATVNGAQSVWNASGSQFRIGSGGSSNTLNITGGGVVNVTTGLTLISRDVGSNNNTVKISGTDSRLTTVNLTIGRSGTGNTLIVSDGGALTLTSLAPPPPPQEETPSAPPPPLPSTNILIAENVGSSGTLQIGEGAAAGTVNATTITGGGGTAVVKFNHSDSAYAFNPKITGSASVQQNGSGATRLSAASDYTGTTDVNAGALVVNGSLSGGSTFTVASGAMVAGTGSVSLAAAQSMLVNGVLSVGDFTGSSTPSVFTVTTSGTGSVVMGAGSAIVLDLFTGAGLHS